ncbi:response regulator [Pelomonas sp. APW6]|uniref:Response regulator n=1 Tax=Roseateles subflavus TaxID=3053353 RepID=A0ABT7LNY9_9BURK|nr:response regulator [Pelomonas sp. APW6]MDL5034596.1 response regulator [Pelomonas sp. APW6]
MTKKLLVVEDQSEIRQLLRMTLEDDDLEIFECADAATGEILARQIMPDAIVLDVMMPGPFDGLELCRRLKTDPTMSAIKVLMVSARGHRNDVLIGRQAGADEYLVKPFSPQRVAEQLRAWFDGPPPLQPDIAV